MKARLFAAFALALVLLLPARGESSTRGGRIGVGYSGFPKVGDMGTIRFDSYSYMFEGGFWLADRGDTHFIFGTRMAVKPWEYRGVPVEVGGTLGFETDGTINDKGELATLIDLGFFFGFSTLVTDQVGVGVQLYPLSLGLGGAETVTDILPATFNIHFLF